MTYTPTDEQIEALALEHFQIDTGKEIPTVGQAAYHRGMARGITASPAFQAIIRAAQVEAWGEGGVYNPYLDDAS